MTSNNYSWLNKIIEEWKCSDLKLNEKAPKEFITIIQKKIQFTFPDDFLYFYKRINGFKDCDFVGNFMFSSWSLERILEEYEKSNDKEFIPFGDHCIDVYRIGYMRNIPGVFKDHQQSEPIASSFEETLTLILEDKLPY